MANNATFFFCLLFSSTLFSFFVQTKQDNPCPYPCYPPPTGPGGGGGAIGTGGTVPAQTPPQTGGTLYPPPAGTSYPTPTGNLPYYAPPPPYGNSLYGQPPPDAILPYFPYYYRKPPHQTDDQSSATSNPGKSLSVIIAAINFIFLVFLVISSS